MSKKFYLAVKWMNPSSDYVSVNVAVMCNSVINIELLSLSVSVKRIDGKDIKYYEDTAIEKAKVSIQELADEFQKAANMQTAEVKNVEFKSDAYKIIN